MNRMNTEGLADEWQTLIDGYYRTEPGQRLLRFVRDECSNGQSIFPPDPYRALRLTRPDDVKAVIFGQDPYPTFGHAMGLAFGTERDVRPLPRSLKNIFKELQAEFGGAPDHGDLTQWARQGVLLLNTVLTVREGKAGSHAKKGWEELTDRLIERVASSPRPRAYLLWGAWAQKKEALIREAARGEVLILKANHPSPLSASRPPIPFFGCGHFRQVNDWLIERGMDPIDWVGACYRSERQGALF